MTLSRNMTNHSRVKIKDDEYITFDHVIITAVYVFRAPLVI